jgi:hypothetical protein
MARRASQHGRSIQGDTPNWRPLLELVGDALVGDFMWMFEVQLADGRQLHAYKHIDTRGYVHLDLDGKAFCYVPPDRYRRVDVASVLTEAFGPLPFLAGVTRAQIDASWAAVERLRQ